jgi:hypothetical protein
MQEQKTVGLHEATHSPASFFDGFAAILIIIAGKGTGGIAKELAICACGSDRVVNGAQRITHATRTATPLEKVTESITFTHAPRPLVDILSPATNANVNPACRASDPISRRASIYEGPTSFREGTLMKSLPNARLVLANLHCV